MPVKRGEEVEHYIDLWRKGEPLSSGQKIKTKKQAIAIGLSEAEANKERDKKKRAGRKKGKRRKNPSPGKSLGEALCRPDPVFGAPMWATLLAAGTVGALLIMSVQEEERRRTEERIREEIREKERQKQQDYRPPASLQGPRMGLSLQMWND